jgi:hypothetical protein
VGLNFITMKFMILSNKSESLPLFPSCTYGQDFNPFIRLSNGNVAIHISNASRKRPMGHVPIGKSLLTHSRQGTTLW